MYVAEVPGIGLEVPAVSVGIGATELRRMAGVN